MGNVEYTKDLEVQCAELRSVIEKMKKEHADEIINVNEHHMKEREELIAKHREEVQCLKNNITLLEGHIDAVVRDNTIMEAQLDIVRMMCGVKE